MASESAFSDASCDRRYVDGLGSSTVPDGPFSRTGNRVAMQHAGGDRLCLDHQSVDHGSHVLWRLQARRIGTGPAGPRDGVRNFLELAADAAGCYLGALSSGCAICGVVMATVAAIIVHVGWRIHVARSWKKRIRCRAARSQN